MFEILKNSDLTRHLLLRAPIGWVVLSSNNEFICRINVGLRTKAAVISDLRLKTAKLDKPNRLERHWADSIQRYFEGEPIDFSNFKIDDRWMSPFTRRVVLGCRKISYGQTASYGQLARGAGSPRAARAVGTVMAKNRFPLVVPCHRILASGGKIGGFSAPTGVQLKRKLLCLEGCIIKKGALIQS